MVYLYHQSVALQSRQKLWQIITLSLNTMAVIVNEIKIILCYNEWDWYCLPSCADDIQSANRLWYSLESLSSRKRSLMTSLAGVSLPRKKCTTWCWPVIRFTLCLRTVWAFSLPTSPPWSQTLGTNSKQEYWWLWNILMHHLLVNSSLV